MTPTLCGTLWCQLRKSTYLSFSVMLTPKECHQQVERTKVRDRTAAPLFSFQACSTEEGSAGRDLPLFWFTAVWQPHHWSAVRLPSTRGSWGVLSTCLLPPRLSAVLRGASPDKQLHKGTRETLLATSLQLWARLSMLIKCLLFIHGSFHSDKHQRQPNYVFLSIQLVFINLIYTYLHTRVRFFKGL